MQRVRSAGFMLIALLATGCCFPRTGFAEVSADSIAKTVTAALESKSTFRVGFSIGWRHTLSSTGDDVEDNKLRRDYYIDPVSNVLKATSIDNGDVVASALLAAFPWKTIGGKWQWARGLGLAANVNLATFAGENLGVFNKSIEGGLGLTQRLNDDVGLAFTIERVFSRRLRDKSYLGKPIVLQGDTLRTISPTDDRFFTNDNLTALSIKVVYFVGH